MIFSYNWLQSFFKKKLPRPEKLAELLTLHSFEVKEVEKAGRDFVLDIDILPNRGPDCFSHIGVARECCAVLNSKLKTLILKPIEDKKLKAGDFISVEVRDIKACPRYTARVITDVKVNFSPQWIKERLKVCGLRPINNIVDITNYVMLETGQPLHAFDGQKLEGKKIIVRFAKKGEKIITLDGEKYELDNDILVIADAKKPVAIAGIKGGKSPEINRKTRTVVIESANFNPRVIRRGSKKIDLKTDASLRFEHGIDPNLTELAINRAAFLIQKIAGGKIVQGLVDRYQLKILPKRIKLDLGYVERLLGLKIPVQKIKQILNKLEFRIIEVRPSYLVVEIPTQRLDITIAEDLIEEIARIYGYPKIPSVFPIASLIPPKRNLDIFWEDMTKNILKEIGFTEVYNYSFISEKEAEIFGFKKSILFEIENPMSIEQKYLRPSLIPNLLKNIGENFKNFGEVKIFELGKIFRKAKFSEEKRMLTGLIAKKEGREEFYDLKGAIDLLLNRLGIAKVWYDFYQPTPGESKLSIWQLKKSAEIKVNHIELGFLGEISPKILEGLKIFSKAEDFFAKGKQIPGRIVLFDLDFEKLTKLVSEEHEFRPISPYPAAIRDISVLIPQGVLVEEVLNKIEMAGRGLIRDVDLFDIYEGEELPEGKKSLAFHIIYQSGIKTLSSKEIDEIQQRIIKVLEEEEWQVRK